MPPSEHRHNNTKQPTKATRQASKTMSPARDAAGFPACCCFSFLLFVTRVLWYRRCATLHKGAELVLRILQIVSEEKFRDNFSGKWRRKEIRKFLRDLKGKVF